MSVSSGSLDVSPSLEKSSSSTSSAESSEKSSFVMDGQIPSSMNFVARMLVKKKPLNLASTATSVLSESHVDSVSTIKKGMGRTFVVNKLAQKSE